MAYISPTKTLLTVMPFLFFLAGYCLYIIYDAPATCLVPSLCGKTVPDVLFELYDKDLCFRISEVRNDPLYAKGTIIHQSPAAGKKIKQRQIISLTITLCKK